MPTIWTIGLFIAQATAVSASGGASSSLPAQSSDVAQVEARSRPAGIPALTPVVLAIEEDVGSKISKSGQAFAIRLAEPIMVDGLVALAAGARGVGEVVHAKRAGGAGVPGELVLAARHLEIGTERLRLRSLRFGGVGTDKIGSVNALAIASATSPVPVSLLGFLITGGEMHVPKGTLATAKVAVDYAFEGGASEDSSVPAPLPADYRGKRNEQTD